MVLYNLKKRSIMILLSLSIYLPLAIFINALWEFGDSNREILAVNRQMFAYGEIKKSIETTSRVPETIADLPQRTQNCIQYYNPHAWEDPQSILFLYRDGRFYSVTFGNARQAVLTYWTEPYYLRGVKEFEIPELGGSVHFFVHGVRVAIFGAIGVLIAVLVSNKLLRNKKADKPEAD